jgi:hypothetical protein
MQDTLENSNGGHPWRTPLGDIRGKHICEDDIYKRLLSAIFWRSSFILFMGGLQEVSSGDVLEVTPKASSRDVLQGCLQRMSSRGVFQGDIQGVLQ